MKKTLTVNLNGRVFNIDEDAFDLLENYLRNLRIYFRKEDDSTEIIADFEARIEELFSERIRLGYEVINIEQVETVISRVGKPSDFGEEKVSEENEKRVGEETPKDVKRKFFRNEDDKVLGGICSGIAAYFGWEVLVVRLIFVVLLFVTSLWIVPVYLLVWLITPVAKTAEEKLQMQGKPITLENIGKVVSPATEPDSEKNGFLVSLVDFLGGAMKVVLIGFGCLVGLPMLLLLLFVLFVLFSILVGFVAFLFGMGDGMLNGIPMSELGILSFEQPILGTVSLCLLVGIPLAAIIYSLIAYFAKWKPVHKGVKWAGLGVWILALILFICSGFNFNTENVSKTFHSWGNSVPTINGNGILAETEFQLSQFDVIEFEDNIDATVLLEPSLDNTTAVLISGDSNIIDNIAINQDENAIEISSGITSFFRSVNPLTITLRTPYLKEIKMEGVGSVHFPNELKGNDLLIKIDGAGDVTMDSLAVRNLIVELEGMGNLYLQGSVGLANFDLEGMGIITANALVSERVIAHVIGLGSVSCYPVQYLDARVDGAGSISYKAEPVNKNVVVNGLGKITLE